MKLITRKRAFGAVWGMSNVTSFMSVTLVSQLLLIDFNTLSLIFRVSHRKFLVFKF
jgi:hypothetical protein